MKSTSRSCLVLFLVAVFSYPYPQISHAVSVENPPGPAHRVEEVLRDLEASNRSRSATAKSYVLTEEELNAYLAYRLQEESNPAVHRVSIRLGDGVFTTFATFNPDEMRPSEGDWTGQVFQGLFRGEQDLEILGRLSTRAGQGAYEVQEARLNGVPIPPTLVMSILSPAGKQLDPPFDPTQPFPLPYGIQRIEVETGRVFIFT